MNRNNIQPFLHITKKPQAKKFTHKQRKIQGLQLKNLESLSSLHQSVINSQRNSSIRNVVNSSYLNSQAESNFSINNNLQATFLDQSRSFLLKNSSFKKSASALKFRKSEVEQKKSDVFSQPKKSILSTQKQSPQKHQKLPKIKENREKKIQSILKKYIDTNFIQSLMNFLNRDWEQQQKTFLKEKRFEALKNLITQKTNFINQLIDDFLSLEIQYYDQEERRLIVSLLFHQNSVILKDYESLFSQILKKIPEDKIVRQQTEIEELNCKLLEIFDPKYLPSTQKMKQRVELFMQGYTSQKNNLLASVVTKLKPNVDFIVQVDRYLHLYQKEVIKTRNQLHATEIQKNNISKLLNKKVNFTPLQFDYQKLKQMTDQSKKQFFEELQTDYINFHKNLHKKSDKIIKRNQKQNNTLQEELDALKKKNQELEQLIYQMKNSVPKKKDASTQVHYLTTKQSIQAIAGSSIMRNFLENVSTPFSFTEKVTGSLISLLMIDKLLYDYEIIRNKTKLYSFTEFMLQWFIIRTGSKKVAQIFTKNFMYSIKQLRGKHKRFNLFSKFCGFNGFRKKNILQDLEYIFFQTQKAWYYMIKIALKYRKKMNQNPTGYHLLPPLQCQSIFKLPLRKVYQIIQQILEEEGFQIPQQFTTKVDHYAINQICKFKQNDEKFQKQQLQEIHILQNINFDIIAGFLIEHMAQQKCLIVEKLLRSITLKQKQIGDVLGYSQFQGIYRKFYKEKRSKIENVYSKICVANQHDMLDIQNSEPIIRAIIEDESGMRGVFDEMQSLKNLIMIQKVALKSEKKILNINSYENFRQRYYYEFYDFYNTTAFLEEIYRIIRSLIRKKLRNFVKDQLELQNLVAQKEPLMIADAQNKEEAQKTKKKAEQEENEQDDEDQYEDNEEQLEKIPREQITTARKKNELENKVQQWGKIVVRIPHFSQKILTIDQIIVHNMRRKQMIDASEFAWRTLRDILVMLSKE